MPFLHRPSLVLVALLFSLFTFYLLFADEPLTPGHLITKINTPAPRFLWKDVKQDYPVTDFRALPSDPPRSLPKLQAEFPIETLEERQIRQERLEAVKQTFEHSWKGYKSHAWLQDEVNPLSGGGSNGFGGWGATLVDSLDTLWMMGLKRDFNQAVAALDYIDFSRCTNEKISVFETNIRYLGGLLSAYDLSGRKYKKILRKAIEVGDLLYAAFDTPNRMPVTDWFWRNKVEMGWAQQTPVSVLLAEYGSFSLEFTRLSQITGDARYYDAITRITSLLETNQNASNIPGLWPVKLQPKYEGVVADTLFTLGSMADSAYEYLPKQHLLLRGRVDTYESMYKKALATAKETLFFKPLSPNGTDLLFSGSTMGYSSANLHHKAESEHLTCFIGGMVALGSKLFSEPDDLVIARQLTDGCIWAYSSMPLGIMPEIFTTQRCGSDFASQTQPGQDPDCSWTTDKWYDAVSAANYFEPLKTESGMTVSRKEQAQQEIKNARIPEGFTQIKDRRYMLRPEAIESVFVLYRTTGDRKLLEDGWTMFEAITKHTRTDIAHAGIKDVTVESPELEDKMESFWLGETLKYFFLLFSEPDVVSLDDFVLNTEAHPLLLEK